MKFNKIYESIFKSASPEEVQVRKAQVDLEDFKDWVEKYLNISYNDLLKKENINKQDIFGRTALMWASNKGYTEIAKQLIDNGADVNIKNNNGFTALMSASMNNHIDIVKLLLDNNADVNVNNGNTALTMAGRFGYIEIVKILKQYGAKE